MFGTFQEKIKKNKRDTKLKDVSVFLLEAILGTELLLHYTKILQ